MNKQEQIRYMNRYNKNKYDRISLMAPKGHKEKIKEAANAENMSMNEYIMSAIAARMEKRWREPRYEDDFLQDGKKRITP